MKILQITPYFPPTRSYGGPPDVIFDLSKRLKDRGNYVEVFTTDVFDRSNRYCSGEQLEFQGIPVTYFRNLSNGLAYHQKVFTPQGLGKALKKHVKEFDIVHIHEYRTFLSTTTSKICVREEIPYLLSSHGALLPFFQKQRIKKLFDLLLGNKIIKNSSAFIAVSQSEASQYEKMGAKIEKVRIVPYGIDVSRYLNLPIEGVFRKKYGIDKSPLILFVGRINRIKGLDFLIEAFARLKQVQPHSILAVVGTDDGYLEELRDIISSNNLNNSVIFTGTVSEDDKIQAYVDADIFVYPSQYEVFGMSPVEALLCGTPAIIAKCSGLFDLLSKIEYPYAVDFGDHDEFLKLMAAVLSNKKKSASIAKRTAEFLKGEIDIPIICEKIFDVYRKVLS
ncbi:MAG: glycosyltransferase [Actinobacteria bacterium]|nr:glycosyltransferase [Actinomycetota bacterium]